MPRDIIKVAKQGVRISDRVVTVKKKGIVYLLRLVVPEQAEVKARPLRAHLGRRVGEGNHGCL
jgi:hypothetical protein